MEAQRLSFRQALIVAIATPVLAGIVSLTWTLAGDFYERVRLASLLTTAQFKIPVDAGFARLTTASEFKCLLVRYGSDHYLRGLATEKDKLDGQRRLDLIPVTLSVAGDKHYLEFALPIHKYLGTQFKLFATPKDGATVEALKKELEIQTADLEAVSIGGPRKDKVYFILKSLWQVTVEGIDKEENKNNFVPPQ